MGAREGECVGDAAVASLWAIWCVPVGKRHGGGVWRRVGCGANFGGRISGRGRTEGSSVVFLYARNGRKRPKIGVAEKQLQFLKSNGRFRSIFGAFLVSTAAVSCEKCVAFRELHVAFPQRFSIDPGNSRVAKKIFEEIKREDKGH